MKFLLAILLILLTPPLLPAADPTTTTPHVVYFLFSAPSVPAACAAFPGAEVWTCGFVPFSGTSGSGSAAPAFCGAIATDHPDDTKAAIRAVFAAAPAPTPDEPHPLTLRAPPTAVPRATMRWLHVHAAWLATLAAAAVAGCAAGAAVAARAARVWAAGVEDDEEDGSDDGDDDGDPYRRGRVMPRIIHRGPF